MEIESTNDLGIPVSSLRDYHVNGVRGDMRAALERDGAIVVRQLVGESKLSRVRDGLLDDLRRVGWLRGNAGNLQANMLLKCVDPEPRYRRTYRRLIANPDLHDIPHDRSLDKFAALIGIEELFRHPRVVLRVVFPETPPTPPHQDWTTVQGSQEAITVWLPLVNCELDMGPLAVLTGSHLNGERPFIKGSGVGGKVTITNATDIWSSASLKLGDAIVFKSLTVHRALPNRTDSLRLSLDFRIQSLAEPIHCASLLPPMGLKSWEDLYANWTTQTNRYYWRVRHPILDCNEDEIKLGAAQTIDLQKSRVYSALLAELAAIRAAQALQN